MTSGRATARPRWIKRTLIVVAAVAVAAIIILWLVSMPRRLSADAVGGAHQANLANGEVLFNAGNCAGCHISSGQPDRKVLGGGMKLKSPFGTFVVPNISSDRTAGIGAWTELEFVNALQRGVGRHGEHLYPAFPYTAYAGLTTSDARDLFGYLRSLPAVAAPAGPHELKFPFNIRRSVGFWKALFFRPAEIMPQAGRPALWNRGRYLVEAAAHCGECHTPRNQLGGLDRTRLYAGAPNLEEGGKFATNITPSKDGIADWTEAEMAEFLSSGTDKCFNEPAGMRDVLVSTMALPSGDVAAIASYIHQLPPKPGNAEYKSC